jgi:3',5'-cyclic AMP phosphodiesterase CpdA
MSVITILHVSDVHFGCPDPRGEQPRITAALIKAVRRHIETGERPPDVCVFSGDLTHSGSEEQFTKGGEWLSELIKPFSNCRLFIIPGNHEVQRPDNQTTLKEIKKVFRGAIANVEIYDSFRDDIAAQTLLNGFYDWHKAAIVRFSTPIVSDWERSRRACHQKININGVQTHLIGLNTAILSCDDKDQGMLVADIKSLNESLRDTDYETELIVVISHHPIGIGKKTNEQWLAKWNDEELQSILLQSTGPHVYFHGHLHEASGSTMSLSTGQNLAFFGAGASYQSPKYPKTRYSSF